MNVTATSGASGSDQAPGTIQNDDTALVVISQIYGGGGNAGAPFKNDFIEIFNRGTTTREFRARLVGAVCFGDGNGPWSVTSLSGTLLPGQYYLVQEAPAAPMASPYQPLTRRDHSMAATAGKGSAAKYLDRR